MLTTIPVHTGSRQMLRHVLRVSKMGAARAAGTSTTKIGKVRTARRVAGISIRMAFLKLSATATNRKTTGGKTSRSHTTTYPTTITNISITSNPVTGWCLVCLRSWMPEMVAVQIRFGYQYKMAICDQCAKEAWLAAEDELLKRKRKDEAVRGRAK